MYRLYILISYLLVPVVALVLFWKGLSNRAYWEHFEERFGFGRRRLDRPGIWVHAVSVGEVVAASSMVAALRTKYPDIPVVLTTVTPTGAQQVRDLFGDEVLHSYAPYDTPGAVRRFFKRMQPRLAIVMETELWPNMYGECGKRGVPLVLANARISPRSVKRYQRFSGLFREALSNGILIAAQSEQDAARFLRVGANPAHVLVTGNLKADLSFPRGLIESGRRFRDAHFPRRPTWIAASTHEGEEAAALDAHERVRARVPGALLLLVPRHPNRFESVAELLAAKYPGFKRRSLSQAPGSDDPVYLVDTLGELPMFYAAADAAFVGGSLVSVGGHNLLEPAVLSLPVITGPHNFNAEQTAGLLRDAGGLEVVADGSALGDAVAALLADPEQRRERGLRGCRAAAQSGGALEKLLRLLDPLLVRND